METKTKENTTGRTWIILGLATLIVVLDQATKILLAPLLTEGPINIIGGSIRLVWVKNTGAGFGILQNQSMFLIFFSFLVLAVMIWKWKQIINEQHIHIPIGLLLGGLLGNLLDRLFVGHVRDFIALWIWPVFNVADAAISISIVWLVIVLWKK